ncbi:serine/threonine protein kinase [Pleurocapsa sp. FMAR1]|uniref:serine/threonine protein kinase n=1 Tax=Pleurocapsa sp. FMAR1 TaxID=3040204 RepID=UPI0029C9954F|nr:serine/threonine-protein kinase [Pleurocapsa sp. FMAR1]
MNQASKPKRIASYQVEQLVGQGSFALVYAVKDNFDLRQPVRALLELIIKGDNEEKKLRKRTFKRTAEILDKVSHYSIPKVHALFESDGKLYLVQEFIHGTNYSKYLDGENPALSIAEVETVFWSVLDGLAQLHSKKIVHRDIKPSNLMRRHTDNSTVIIDFGSACDLSTLNAVETSIGTNEQLGYTRIYTPGYAHPEQRDGMATATPQWDLYALAKTILALRLGKNPPWNQPISVEELGFSQQMTQLLEEMLKTEGCQLIDACDAIALDLESNQPVAVSATRTVRKGRRKNRKWLVLGGLVTAIVALTGGIYVFAPEPISSLFKNVRVPFVPQCPNYVKNELKLPVPDRGFAARFYYPENSVAGNSTLEILQSGNLVAQATDEVPGFIWVKSLADGSNFPTGNYTMRITVPKSLPYEKEVTLDPDFPIAYLGNVGAIQVVCELNAKTPIAK